MSRLSEISAFPTLREFAQGAAQSAIMPVADFLAPTVEVATSVGRFKQYSEKNRFHIPHTLRTLGGRASELRFEATDATYNCEPHALDYPVDNLEQLEAEGLEDMLREGVTAVAEMAALSHESSVINAALDAVGAGTAKTWNASVDPVADVDDAILSVIKAAKYGSLMGVGVLFGATAWKVFKNQEKVRGRFVVGNGGGKGSGNLGLAVPTEQSATQMFIGTPEVRTSYMIYEGGTLSGMPPASTESASCEAFSAFSDGFFRDMERTRQSRHALRVATRRLPAAPARGLKRCHKGAKARPAVNGRFPGSSLPGYGVPPRRPALPVRRGGRTFPLQVQRRRGMARGRARRGPSLRSQAGRGC